MGNQRFIPVRVNQTILYIALVVLTTQCNFSSNNQLATIQDLSLEYKDYTAQQGDIKLDRSKYFDKLHGFWLGQCIANWTGLITEMDKIGNIGEIKTGPFYTREDWGKRDLPSIWSEGKPSELSSSIDFIYAKKDSVWGSDDDTDIEYMYQYLLYEHQTSILSPEQIREGWLEHIKAEEENYLWVSNQRAYDLMQDGVLPPLTGDPQNNKEFEMIDAQLSTEILGLFSPMRTDLALKMAELPIQTTARQDAELAAEFYVILHSLAATINPKISIGPQLKEILVTARNHLPEESYTAKMYDFVDSCYTSGMLWEETRDALYERYQVNEFDGYNFTSRNLYCNSCFASGINFGASIISLMYGEGNLKETIKIGALCGWDSDNPTATWGGLIGFIIGKKGIEAEFGHEFSDKFNIHRTRINFPNNGIDNFDAMAEKGIYVIDRVVQEEMGGGIDLENNLWYIPEQ